LKALVVVVAIAMAGCTAAPQSMATPTPIASASPIATNSAESKAADFRIRLDLLLGEHVLIIAKQSSATARQAEYTGYLRLLTTNGADLTELVRSAMGDGVAGRFAQTWSSQNDYLVSYTIGLVTHDTAKAAAAQSGLTGTFVPQFAQFLSDVTQIPSGLILPLVTQHELEMKAMLDDQVARNYPTLYADIRASYAHATQVGDVIAPRIAGKFPDKFPGSSSGPAVDLRSSLNIRWQEHSYLTTMRTSAIVGRRQAEVAAAAGALAESSNALDALFTDLLGASVAKRFDVVWAAANAAAAGEASATTAAQFQRSFTALADASVAQLAGWLLEAADLAADASGPALEARLEALVTVIDKQRSKDWSMLAGDDRSAATATEVVADLVAAAVIAKLPARFG
jgi:hypothetical protein